MSFFHKHLFWNLYIFASATRYQIILIFQTMNFVRSKFKKSDSLKYVGFTPSGCKDIGIRIFELVAKVCRLEYLLLSVIEPLLSNFISKYTF